MSDDTQWIKNKGQATFFEENVYWLLNKSGYYVARFGIEHLLPMLANLYVPTPGGNAWRETETGRRLRKLPDLLIYLPEHGGSIIPVEVKICSRIGAALIVEISETLNYWPDTVFIIIDLSQQPHLWICEPPHFTPDGRLITLTLRGSECLPIKPHLLDFMEREIQDGWVCIDTPS